MLGKCHAGFELHVVGRTEDLVRFIDGFDRIELRDLTCPEARELWEDEPHPVRCLTSGAKLGKNGLVDFVLSFDEAIQSSRMIWLLGASQFRHPKSFRCSCVSGPSARVPSSFWFETIAL